MLANAVVGRQQTSYPYDAGTERGMYARFSPRPRPRFTRTNRALVTCEAMSPTIYFVSGNLVTTCPPADFGTVAFLGVDKRWLSCGTKMESHFERSLPCIHIYHLRHGAQIKHHRRPRPREQPGRSYRPGPLQRLPHPLENPFLLLLLPSGCCAVDAVRVRCAAAGWCCRCWKGGNFDRGQQISAPEEADRWGRC